MIHRARVPLLVLLCMLPLAFATEYFREHAQGHFLATQRYEDTYYLPPPDFLIAMSLGHRETAADLIWMKTLVYFGEELNHRGDVANLYRYTEAMLALDPRFKKVYEWVASAAIYRTGEVTLKDVNQAIAFLKRGIKYFPDDGELAWDIGATYSFELPPLLKTKAEIAEAKRKGLEYLELASLRGAGPSWLALQAAGQLGELGKTEQAIRHLEDVYATASDPSTKKQIEERIAHLRSSAYAEALRHTNEELAAQRMKSFPYMDDSLFLQVGQRPPFDGMALLARGFDPVITHVDTLPDTKTETPAR